NLRVKTPKGNAKNRTNDPRFHGLVGVQISPTTIGLFEAVHKSIILMQHNDPKMCALCYDSVVTYCYGVGARLNDNISPNGPYPIAFWKLSAEVMDQLNSLQKKHTDFEGVTSCKGKWKASIKLDLGVYETKQDAALAHDAAILIFNLRKHPNFANHPMTAQVAVTLLKKLLHNPE
ncbi:MAG: hypothetical protein ACMG6E_03955, partial [Candidatus Roizmanbacteria bacterium]